MFLLPEFFDYRRPHSEIWAELVEREPRLAELEAEVRSGKYGPVPDRTRHTKEQYDDPEWTRAHGEHARLSLKLADRVSRLLGPGSANPNPIIRSRKASELGHFYLSDLPRQSPPNPS
jgi:hypothetical protein